MKKKTIVKQAIKRKFPMIQDSDSLQDAINLMTQANVSVLAVKSDEIFLGMITVSDVMHGLANDHDLEQTKIESFMTPCSIDGEAPGRNPCIQLDEDQNVRAAIRVMYEGGINHLLVTGTENDPSGIVSSLDLVKLFASNEQRPG